MAKIVVFTLQSQEVEVVGWLDRLRILDADPPRSGLIREQIARTLSIPIHRIRKARPADDLLDRRGIPDSSETGTTDYLMALHPDVECLVADIVRGDFRRTELRPLEKRLRDVQEELFQTQSRLRRWWDAPWWKRAWWALRGRDEAC